MDLISVIFVGFRVFNVEMVDFNVGMVLVRLFLQLFLMVWVVVAVLLVIVLSVVIIFFLVFIFIVFCFIFIISFLVSVEVLISFGCKVCSFFCITDIWEVVNFSFFRSVRYLFLRVRILFFFMFRRVLKVMISFKYDVGVIQLCFFSFLKNLKGKRMIV